MGYFTDHIVDSVACVVVQFCSLRVAFEGDCKECFAFHRCPFGEDLLFDAGVYQARVSIVYSFGYASRVFVKGVSLLKSPGDVLGLQTGHLHNLVEL